MKYKNIMKYLKKFNLFEKLTDVNIDVDMIYNEYFKEGIDYINKTDKLDKSLFKKATIYSDSLSSPLCIEANKINPVEILINVKNDSPNHYNPYKKIINLHVSYTATNYVSQYKTLTDAINGLYDSKQRISLSNQFKESTIKGSIHHELVHWIDDSLNNQHILTKLNKAKGKPIKNVNFALFELQSQIHNIVQLKRKYEDVWDNLTFDEMMSMSPALSVVMNNIDSAEKTIWIKRLKKRMSREGLLGKNMYNN